MLAMLFMHVVVVTLVIFDLKLNGLGVIAVLVATVAITWVVVFVVVLFAVNLSAALVHILLVVALAAPVAAVKFTLLDIPLVVVISFAMHVVFGLLTLTLAGVGFGITLDVLALAIVLQIPVFIISFRTTVPFFVLAITVTLPVFLFALRSVTVLATCVCHLRGGGDDAVNNKQVQKRDYLHQLVRHQLYTVWLIPSIITKKYTGIRGSCRASLWLVYRCSANSKPTFLQGLGERVCVRSCVPVCDVWW